jgi:hypothetical protein
MISGAISKELPLPECLSRQESLNLLRDMHRGESYTLKELEETIGKLSLRVEEMHRTPKNHNTQRNYIIKMRSVIRDMTLGKIRIYMEKK